MRRRMSYGMLGWAVLGALVGLLLWLPSANADARVIGAILAIGGPAAAVAASFLLRAHRDRTAGAFLLLSVVTPMGFVFLPNLVALLLGVMLVAAPGVVLRDRKEAEANAPATGRSPA